MRHLSWLITLPLAAVILSFAVSNRETATLTLFPLPFEMAVPLYILGLGALVLGFLLGGLVAWLAGGRRRRELRLARRRIAGLERDLAAVEARAKTAEVRNAELTRAATAVALAGTPAETARPASAIMPPPAAAAAPPAP